MYRGKHYAKRTTLLSRLPKSSRRRYKLTMPALLAILLAVFTVGGTMAFLIARTTPVENKFTPAKVSCSVVEDYSNNQKSSIKVNNTGNTEAFIRVKLISYRVAGNDNHRIGGSAPLPQIILGSNWKVHNGYYYYTLPVAPNAETGNLLGSNLSLNSYTDVDGGRQVIEVIAEAIQSEPARAIGGAWGVSISPNSVTPYSTGN